MSLSRRSALKLLAAAVPTAYLSKYAVAADTPVAGATEAELPPAPVPIPAPEGFGVIDGPFKPDLESLSAFQIPDWYRDAKFGIWAHWGPQCQPEMGDWYAQKLYQFKHPDYEFQVQNLWASFQGGIQGSLQRMESRPVGSGTPDRALQKSRREIFHRDGPPSRQLRQF